MKLISELRVPSCDVDSFGHVNNAVYLRYCEAARNDYMLQRGLVFADFKKWNAGPVLASANLEFKRPAVIDDELLVLGVIWKEGRIQFVIDHEIVRKVDKAVVCRANLRFVFVDLTTQKPCRIPEGFSAAFHLDAR